MHICDSTKEKWNGGRWNAVNLIPSSRVSGDSMLAQSNTTSTPAAFAATVWFEKQNDVNKKDSGINWNLTTNWDKFRIDYLSFPPSLRCSGQAVSRIEQRTSSIEPRCSSGSPLHCDIEYQASSFSSFHPYLKLRLAGSIWLRRFRFAQFSLFSFSVHCSAPNPDVHRDLRFATTSSIEHLPFNVY
jgi:hypothetical protein